MTYNFRTQKRLLNTALRLLKDSNLLEISAFGGGTALAGLYWNHRYSTDIDYFIYGEENHADKLKPRHWTHKAKKAMNKIHYEDGNFKYNGIYLEYTITSDTKIQFMDVSSRTETPFNKHTIWHHSINVESIEEIIAKKIYFRGNKGNARDIFDITVALYKNPTIIKSLNLSVAKIKLFLDTITEIFHDSDLKDNYLQEINEMNPHPDYEILSKNAISYLFLFLSTYYRYLNESRELNEEQCIKLESQVYEKVIKQ